MTVDMIIFLIMALAVVFGWWIAVTWPIVAALWAIGIGLFVFVMFKRGEAKDKRGEW